jgi:phenylacetate-coenzyme A ligase PaaK-like adenylate-forming protein
VTQQILKAYDVKVGTSVVVCHPFDPWAIGGIFRDAALACGANVLPLGLSAGDPSLWSALVNFEPMVLCGSASLLIQWYASGKKSGVIPPERQRIIFHAAEPLLSSVRKTCSKVWNSRVVNVYGMAEFDSIASEGLCGPGLILSPHLEFALSTSKDKHPISLVEGAEGVLLIRIRGESDWYYTQDMVKVLDTAPANEILWSGSWRIEHLSRTDNTLQLPDGSLVYAEQLQAIAQEVSGIDHIQMQLIRRIPNLPVVKLMVSQCKEKILSADQVKNIVLNKCFELADAVKHQVVLLEISVVPDSELIRTERGKIKLFLEYTDESNFTDN